MIFIVMLYPKIELQSFSRSAEPVSALCCKKRCWRKQQHAGGSRKINEPKIKHAGNHAGGSQLKMKSFNTYSS